MNQLPIVIAVLIGLILFSGCDKPQIEPNSIRMCTGIEESVVLEIEGFGEQVLFDSLTFRYENGGYTSIFTEDIAEGGFYIWFKGDTAGVYQVEDSEISGHLGSVYIAHSDSVQIDVTHYGQIGECVQGTVTGIAYTSQYILAPHYPFIATFSVLREE